MIVTWEDQQQDRLSELFPGWQVWYIRRAVVRQTTWHARPEGSPVATVAASSPDELAEQIQASLAGGPGSQG